MFVQIGGATSRQRPGHRDINPEIKAVRLAIVTETFPPEVNGVAMTFGVMTRELARRGHAVTVYRPWRPELANLPAETAFNHVPVAGMPIPFYPLMRLGFPAYRRLRREWRERRPDLVHVATEGPLGASAITVARGLGIPVTSSFHTNFHSYSREYGFGVLNRVVLAWLRYVHNRTRATFAPTPELCAMLETVGFRNLRVMSRGVDITAFGPNRRSAELRASWGAGPEDPVVIHVGRLAAEKNYALLFRTYAAMRAINPRLRCVLVGDGPLRSRLQREHPECVFPGSFNRQEIGRSYASADLYIHASLSETFGNVVTEAMASGLAVTGFDYAAARQFIRHETNGLLAPCDQPDALVRTAERLIADRELRVRLGSAARAAVERQSWASVVERFERDLAIAAGEQPEPGAFSACAHLPHEI